MSGCKKAFSSSLTHFPALRNMAATYGSSPTRCDSIFTVNYLLTRPDLGSDIQNFSWCFLLIFSYVRFVFITKDIGV